MAQSAASHQSGTQGEDDGCHAHPAQACNFVPYCTIDRVFTRRDLYYDIRLSLSPRLDSVGIEVRYVQIQLYTCPIQKKLLARGLFFAPISTPRLATYPRGTCDDRNFSCLSMISFMSRITQISVADSDHIIDRVPAFCPRATNSETQLTS